MEKHKRWHLFVIFAVIVLTLYNILPTVLYYARPLKTPINEQTANKIATGIIQRIDSLEPFTIKWLQAQSKNLGLKPRNISLDPENPRIARVEFKNAKEAHFFGRTLARSGALISFVPAQLTPDVSSLQDPEATTVLVQRKIGLHLDPAQQASLFHFIPKEISGSPSPEYRDIIHDRTATVALSLGGESTAASWIYENPAQIENDKAQEGVVRLARKIVEYERTFGDHNAITQRYYATFSQIDPKKSNHTSLISKFQEQLVSAEKRLSQEISSIKSEQEERQKSDGFLDTATHARLEILENQQNMVHSAALIVERNRSLFESGKDPLTQEQVMTSLAEATPDASKVQSLSLGGRNPFVSHLLIDWNKDLLEIALHDDVKTLRNQKTSHEMAAIEVEKLNQLLYNEVARASQGTDETITPTVTGFAIEFNQVTNSLSLLALDLASLAKLENENLTHLITQEWKPTSADFSKENFPLLQKEALSKAKLGLAIYAPLTEQKGEEGFRNGSIYVIARGLQTLINKYEKTTDSVAKTQFEKDLNNLKQLMRQSGFIGYAASSTTLSDRYKNDYIFELPDFYSYLLAASREDFSVKGSKRFALLELTDQEQRLLTLNKIEDQIHEDLLLWHDSYNQARVNVNPQARYDVPKPYQNVFVQNLILSVKKYFRGDQRKVLKWGLDLSGGKTVRVGLKDQNNRPITDPEDLHAAVNELYQRVNRLGLSEVAIRVEGNTIAVDFPGSQGLSASDLIQASAMYFHIVNEKFSPFQSALGEAANTFLEDVWNEAVITNRTDPESINLIAWQHLGGNPDHPTEFNPLSSHAQLLYDHGLRLVAPKDVSRSSNFNDELSMVTRYRGEDFTDWAGQTHPLLIVFNNYALAGSNLTDVQVGYDPREGNMLHFSVLGSHVDRTGQKSNPRESFYRWTSQFSEESVAGTEREKISHGRGWRMAVILNGSVVSAPTLNSPLKDSARITGSFSQAEVNKLAADLKAGSLSFTPTILSEENVSPELGKEQRMQGILAGILGILLVTLMMCGYYRFAGFVAICAVLFNLLIVWAVLQNLGAALTLPGIAGIILSVGMAVDANVLVFERIREEFAISKRLAPAIQAGYRKAFTAIVDSNLTTIIAAVILLNFDSGPIKGFALTLMIGILSSMFTALFMTRTFFAVWVQNPKHKELKMMQLFHTKTYDFLGKSKQAFVIVAIIVLIGGALLVKDRHSMLGMDFTGGYALTVNLEEQPEGNYRQRATAALVKAGANPTAIQIRELNKPYLLRIQLGQTMEQAGQPFHSIQENPVENSLFSYQSNPRIVWIVEGLEAGGLKLNSASLPDLNNHWTQVSGQLSTVMRNQALLGLALALLAILIYVTFRFEFKYAISATLGLAHDIVVTLAFMGLFHLFFGAVQLDLAVVAALMTIVGYSLNDTIIIFDRIREDLKFSRKRSFSEVVNQAVNETLSRTVMTSSTTCIVLLALVFFGGASIFNFSLIMTLGVIIGTFSSIFIAAPLLVFFHNRQQEKSENHKMVAD